MTADADNLPFVINTRSEDTSLGLVVCTCTFYTDPDPIASSKSSRSYHIFLIRKPTLDDYLFDSKVTTRRQ
jgi:hypothetical protein